jgi:hypothetical protein
MAKQALELEQQQPLLTRLPDNNTLTRTTDTKDNKVKEPNTMLNSLTMPLPPGLPVLLLPPWA